MKLIFILTRSRHLLENPLNFDYVLISLPSPCHFSLQISPSKGIKSHTYPAPSSQPALQSLSNGPTITSCQLSLMPSTARYNCEPYCLPQGVQGRHSVPDKSNANYSPTFMLSVLPATKTCPLAPCLPPQEGCAQPQQCSVCACTANLN